MSEVKEFLELMSILWKHKLITVAGIKLSFGNLLIALILLLFATRLSRLTTRLISKKIIEPFVQDKSSRVTYETFSFYGCLVGFVSISLTIAGIPLTIFTVIGGALAIGVGFGSQNIVNNFISGMILLVEKPIKIGDVVELDDITGSVISIGTRSIKVKNADNKIFIVPNSFFLEKRVLNWSYNTSIIRTTVTFGVAYGSDVRLIEHICIDILLNTDGVEQTPVPQVLFESFGDSTLNFQLVFYCDLNKVSSMAEVRSQIRFKIDDKFREHKVNMAFPQRDVNLRVDKQLEVKVLS